MYRKIQTISKSKDYDSSYQSCIKSVSYTHLENDAYDPTQIKEEFDFLMDTETTGGRLYVNPMVFPQLERNPFIQTERILPVEFQYPYKYNLICTLMPVSYTHLELPPSCSIPVAASWKRVPRIQVPVR